MDSAIKAEWLTALRSGEYEQADGALQRSGRFCCLGVLCDIAVKQGLGEWSSSEGSTSETFTWTAPAERYAGRQDNAVLPTAVANWADASSSDGALGFAVLVDGQENGSFRTNLAALNDGGMPFDQIADIIENQL